jgi:hypothetical protein
MRNTNRKQTGFSLEGKMIATFFRLLTVWKMPHLQNTTIRTMYGKPTGSRDNSVLGIAVLVFATMPIAQSAMAQDAASFSNPGEKHVRGRSAHKGKSDIDGKGSKRSEETALCAEARQMREVIEKLEGRIGQLEAQMAAIVSSQLETPLPAPASPAPKDLILAGAKRVAQSNALTEADRGRSISFVERRST